MYESSTKETSGCASNLLAHEDLGQFEEAHHWNIQAKFYNIKFPLVYESVNIWDSLYEEHGATLKHNIWDSLYHGATLKHKCGKKYSSIAHFFIYIFLGLIYFSLAFFGTMLYWMMIITLLFIYISMITTRYYSKVWLYMNAFGGVSEYAMNQEWQVKITNGGFATNTMSTTWSC